MFFQTEINEIQGIAQKSFATKTRASGQYENNYSP
jgi:hypothetical protein